MMDDLVTVNMSNEAPEEDNVRTSTVLAYKPDYIYKISLVTNMQEYFRKNKFYRREYREEKIHHLAKHQ